MKIFSYLLIIFGILWCLLGGYYLWVVNDPNRLSFSNYQAINATNQTAHTTKSTSLPVRITISDLGINIPVMPTEIKNNVWQTSPNGALYLLSSPIPGASGNSIIYAHNWRSLFGNLVNAKPGQVVEIYYADGSKKRFVIEYTSTVEPTASSILSQSKDERITLYTCTGFLDSKRFVAVAVLNKAPSFASISRP